MYIYIDHMRFTFGDYTTTCFGVPAKNAKTFSTARARPASVVSGVTPAEWGLRTTFDNEKNCDSGGRGSVSNTSNPAQAMRFVRSASIRASSRTLGPRAVFAK